MSRRLLSLCALAVLAAVAACTEPDRPLVVTVTPSDTATGYPYSGGSYAALACDYTVKAVAKGGRPGESATWMDMREEWLLSGSSYASQDTVTAAEVATLFNASTITTDTPLSSDQFVYWSRPFQLTQIYHYETSRGHLDSTRFVLHCE